MIIKVRSSEAIRLDLDDHLSQGRHQVIIKVRSSEAIRLDLDDHLSQGRHQVIIKVRSSEAIRLDLDDHLKGGPTVGRPASAPSRRAHASGRPPRGTKASARRGLRASFL